MSTNADCSANVVLQEDVAKWTECQLCCNVLSEDTKGRFLTINEQLPSSCLSSVRLLRLLGISCPVPDSHFLDVATIHACTKCYSLLMEADSVYQTLFSLASKMKKVWAKHTMDDGIFGLRAKDSKSIDVSMEGGQPKGDPIGVSVKAGTSGNKQGLCQSSSSTVDKSYIPILPKLNLAYIPDLPKPSIVPDNEMHSGTEVQKDEAREMRKDSKSQTENEMRTQRNEIQLMWKEAQQYVCGLCGSGFNSERSWLLHFKLVHRIRKWFDYNSQSALKKSLQKGYQKKIRINPKDVSEGNSASDYTDCVHKCSACDEDFQTQELFVEHLREYHRFSIVEDSVCHSDDSSSGTDVAFQEAIISSATPPKGDVVTPREKEEENMGASDSASVYMETEEDPLAEAEESGGESETFLQKQRRTEGTENRTFEDSSSSLENENDVQILEVATTATAKNAYLNVLHAKRKRDGAFCNLCGEHFLNNLLLLKHKENVHNVVNNTSKSAMLECKYCGLKLRYISSLRLHLAKAHNQKLDSEELATKSCTKIQHQEEISAKLSTNVDPSGSSGKTSLKYQCNVCLYQSETRQELKLHARKEHNISLGSRVECKYCGKYYAANYLESHINVIHESEMSDASNDCPVKITSQTNVCTNSSEGNSKSKWECALCQRQFSSYQHIRQHNFHAHSSKIHLCSVCGKTFSRKRDLTYHGKRQHMEKARGNCPHCSKSYSTRMKLRFHMLKDHNVAWEDSYSEDNDHIQRDNDGS